MTRDLALILSATLIVITAMICATMLVINVEGVDVIAAFGVITAGIGIAGVALGRLSGAPVTEVGK